MRKFFSQRIKMVLVLCLTITSIIMIKVVNSNNIAKIKEQRTDDSIIKIKYGSKLYENKNTKDNINQDVEIDLNKNILDNLQNSKNEQKIKYKEREEDNFISKIKDNLYNLFNINKDVVIDTKDIAAPDNIQNIDIKILEDNAIINFTEPKDNGTDYEYIIENEDKKETLNFHSEAGIYGYSYKISNSEETVADESANKLDNAPIIIQNIDWDKDYYLHIRTIDKSNNISENNTIKITIPSFGLKIEYIDKETGNVLSIPEKVTGMIHDSYDAKKKIKEISDYTLIGASGEQEGMLKRELTTVRFEYAQNKVLNIKYIDEENGMEIAETDEIEGYIGKELELNPKVINEYVPIDYKKNIKMQRNTDEVVFKYKKFENKVAEIITNNSNEVNNNGQLQEKNDKTNISSENGDNNIVENKIKEESKKEIRIRYVDINTNKLLLEDKVIANDEKQIKYKLKEIEGYNLVNNIDGNSDDRYKQNRKLNIRKEETSDDKSIMDEIISSLDINDNIKNDNDSGLTEDERRRVMAQYEIVMNCDESDYIIYYKK